MVGKEREGPGGRTARKGNEDVIRGTNHGVGGDGEPELPVEIASEAIGTEAPVFAAAARNGLVKLALGAHILVLIIVASN